MATQYYTASSIDGFIADPDNSLTWLFQFSEQTGMEDQYPKFIAEVGAMAMGSTTYEWIADHTGFLSRSQQVGVHHPDLGVQQSGAATRRWSRHPVRVRRCGASARGDGAGRGRPQRLAGGWW